MTLNEKVASLKKDGELYLHDEFLGAVLKIVLTDNGEKKFLKWKGRKEKQVDHSNGTAADIFIDVASKKVTKEFYEKY